MLPRTYQVCKIGLGELHVMAKPVAGEWLQDEILGLKQLGIAQVVSLLEFEEAKEVGLELEGEVCHQFDLMFSIFPIADRQIPNDERAAQFISQLYQQISQGYNTVIHCRAGIGRTGIIASALLIKQGLSVEQAIEKVSIARGIQIPDTQLQIDWLYQIEPIL